MDPRNTRIVRHEGAYPLPDSTVKGPAPRVGRLASLEVLARAEKRMTGHIARHGIDAEALSIFATYERMYAATLLPVEDWPVDVLDRIFADIVALSDDEVA